MPYWAYILRSGSSGRYYCGSTDDCERRLCEHNDPNYHGSKTTKRFKGQWILVWRQGHSSRSSALQRERQIKKRGIGRFLVDAQLMESRQRRD